MSDFLSSSNVERGVMLKLSAKSLICPEMSFLCLGQKGKAVEAKTYAINTKVLSKSNRTALRGLIHTSKLGSIFYYSLLGKVAVKSLGRRATVTKVSYSGQP